MGFDSGKNDLAFATPRSWEMVSNILNNICSDVDKMYSLIAGLVGTGVAVEFRTWAKVYSELPDIADIFAGKAVDVPKNTDALYALVSSMTFYAAEHKNDMNAIANSIRYAFRMPPDFSTVLMKDYQYIDEDYKRKLMTVPEFVKWNQQVGSLMNGSVK